VAKIAVANTKSTVTQVCQMMMSGKDCWNKNVLRCWRYNTN